MNSTNILAANKVKCPYCGYRMPIYIAENARCEGLTVRCKGKKCKRLFEIRLGR